jgi:tRNA pseudouridine32 synthase / 23S rRNA pseudouridine746 synthase
MNNSFIEDSVLYRDDDIIVINKPAGIPVHSGKGGGENLEQYFHELCFGYTQPPGLGHRLDRNTSGCLILGRSKDALRDIGKMFMAGRISKTYWAITKGANFMEDAGRIDLPLRKQIPLKHLLWMEVHPEGQSAVTDYKVLGRYNDFTFLELYPRTGRTHQLRVHCQAMGSPIVGDGVYGEKIPNDIRPMMHLHARSLIIPQHDRDSINVTAPPPAHMVEMLQKCGYK